MQYSLEIFQESLKSPESVKMYTYYVEKFRKYHGLVDFDSIVKQGKTELQKMVETYVIYLKKNISPNSVGSQVNPIKTFLEANEIDLNWRKIKRLYPSLVKRSGSSAYSTDDVKRMIEATPQTRNKAIIHFIASSGVRVGAIPGLKLKHMRDMPLNCKMITVYEDSIEEYQTFLTPEASNSLDDYLDQRRKNNEVLTDESPLFRERYQLASVKARGISKEAIQSIITRALENSGVRGQKKNNRYSEQLIHGFRKRFNTLLKLNNQVNDNAIEKMMGHSHGLDGTYFQGTIEQLFEEFSKGIESLTVSDEQRDKVKIIKLESEKSELEIKNKRIDELEKRFESELDKDKYLQRIKDEFYLSISTPEGKAQIVKEMDDMLKRTIIYKDPFEENKNKKYVNPLDKLSKI